MSFLYKKCTLIKSGVISKLALVPEYMEALNDFRGNLDDQSVYEIVKAVYKKLYDEGRGSDTARSILKQISRDVTGDSQTWRNEGAQLD